MTARRPTCLGAIALAAVLAAVPACDDERRVLDRSDLPEVSTEPAATVTISTSGFDTDAVTITAGDSIEFVADGDDVGMRTDDDVLTTGVLLDGETSLVFFDAAGTVTVEHLDTDATLAVTVEPAADEAP